MKKGFVFDLDGTLVDSLPGIAEAINRSLKSLGLPTHSPDEVRKMVGRGSRELCRSALASGEMMPGDVPDTMVEDLRLRFVEIYHGTWERGTIVYPGIKEMLAYLAQRGHRIAVLSNKPHEVTVPLVAKMLEGIPFSPVMGNAELFPRKPNPAALLHIAESWGMASQEVVMIGDSAHDGKTARNAETELVLVGWGYSTRLALEAFNAPIAESAEELGSILTVV